MINLLLYMVLSVTPIPASLPYKVDGRPQLTEGSLWMSGNPLHYVRVDVGRAYCGSVSFREIEFAEWDRGRLASAASVLRMNAGTRSTCAKYSVYEKIDFSVLEVSSKKVSRGRLRKGGH